MVHSLTLLRSVRGLGAILALGTLFVAGLVTSQAQAKITTKKYTVPVVWMHGATPFDSDNCSAAAFASFPRVKGAVSASVTFKNPDGRSFTNSKPGPLFDDVSEMVRIYAVGSEKHWLNVTSVGSDGGTGPNDCASEVTRLRPIVAKTATVTVTIDKSSSCDGAKAARTAEAKGLAYYKKVLAMETRQDLIGIRTISVRARTARLARANQEVKREC